MQQILPMLIMTLALTASISNAGVLQDNTPEWEISAQTSNNNGKYSLFIEVKGNHAPVTIKVFGPGIGKKIFKKASAQLKQLKSGTYLIVVQDEHNYIRKKEVEVK